MRKSVLRLQCDLSGLGVLGFGRPPGGGGRVLARLRLSVGLVEVVLDLRGGEYLEDTVLADDGELDVGFVHLSFEGLAHGEERGVDGVVELDVVVVALLEKGPRVLVVLPDRRRLPAVVRACPRRQERFAFRSLLATTVRFQPDSDDQEFKRTRDGHVAFQRTLSIVLASRETRLDHSRKPTRIPIRGPSSWRRYAPEGSTWKSCGPSSS